MLPVVAMLAAQGLSLVANAVLAKGKEFIEDKTGLKLAPEMPPEDLLKLRQFELENETELTRMQAEENKLSAALAEKMIDAQIAEGKAVTDRWQADATGDTLTKRIRPGVLIYLLALFTGFAIANAAGMSVGQEYSSIVSGLLELVFGAYFGGRSVEKVAEMYFNHKVEIGGAK